MAVIVTVLKSPRLSSPQPFCPVCFLFLLALHLFFFLSQHCLQLHLQPDSPHAVCFALQLAPAKPGQSGSKTWEQLEERPACLAKLTDKRVTTNAGWNTGECVCYTERRVVQRHDSGSRVTRDRAICLCIFHSKGTTVLCQMHDGVYDVCVLTFLELNYITALINCLCAEARTHKLVYEPCHMHDWAYTQTRVHMCLLHVNICCMDRMYVFMHACTHVHLNARMHKSSF